MSQLATHCCPCSPTCGLPFLSKSWASSGAHRMLLLADTLQHPEREVTGQNQLSVFLGEQAQKRGQRVLELGAWAGWPGEGSRWETPSPSCARSCLLGSDVCETMASAISHLLFLPVAGKLYSNYYYTSRSDFKGYCTTHVMRRSNLFRQECEQKTFQFFFAEYLALSSLWL